MKIDDRSNTVWFFSTVVAGCILAALYYGHRVDPDVLRGGSTLGLWSGLLATGCMAVCGALSLYKMTPVGVAVKGPFWRRQLGSVLTWVPFLGRWRIQDWVRAHVFLGTFSVIAVGFHAGFRVHGVIELLLVAVFLSVVMSGWFGLMIQQSIPREMTAALPLESFVGQRRRLCRELRMRIVRAAVEVFPTEMKPQFKRYAWGGESRKFREYTTPQRNRINEANTLPSLVQYASHFKTMFDNGITAFIAPGHIATHTERRAVIDAIESLERRIAADSAVSAEERRNLPALYREIVAVCDERIQLQELQHYHRRLQRWLQLHIPLCWMLSVFSIAHVAASLYY